MIRTSAPDFIEACAAILPHIAKADSRASVTGALVLEAQLLVTNRQVAARFRFEHAISTDASISWLPRALVLWCATRRLDWKPKRGATAEWLAAHQVFVDYSREPEMLLVELADPAGQILESASFNAHLVGELVDIPQLFATWRNSGGDGRTATASLRPETLEAVAVYARRYLQHGEGRSRDPQYVTVTLGSPYTKLIAGRLEVLA